MANDFGLTQRRLAQDANDGNVVPKSAITQRQQGQSGFSATSTRSDMDTRKYIEGNGYKPNPWVNALVSVAGIVAQRASGVQQKRAETEDIVKQAGYTGELKHSQSFLGQMFSAEDNNKRHVQQLAVKNNVDSTTNKLLSTVNNYVDLPPSEFQSKMKGTLDELLDKHEGDVETQAMVVERFQKQSAAIAETQATKYGEWATNSRINAAAAQLRTSRLGVKAAVMNGDGGVIEASMLEAGKTFLTKPDNVAPDAWNAIQAGAVIDALNEGDDSLKTLAQEAGVTFDDDTNRKIDQAQIQYDAKQEAALNTAYGKLRTLSRQGDVDELERFYAKSVGKHPELQEDIDRFMQVAGEIQLEKNMKHTQKLSRVDDLVANNSINGTPSERTDAINLAIERKAEEHIQNVTGDYSKEVTTEDVRKFAVSNTEEFSEMWSRAGSKDALAVVSLTQDTFSLLNKASLTEAEQSEVLQNFGAIEKLYKTNDSLLLKSIKNDKDRTNLLKLLDYTKNGTQSPVSAMQSVRNRDKMKATMGEVKIQEKNVKAVTDDLISTLVDEKGEGFLGIDMLSGRGALSFLGMRQEPENLAQIRQAAKVYVRDALEEAGGDMDDAIKIAQGRFLSSGTVAANTFIPNGARIDREIAQSGIPTNLNGLIETWNNDPATRQMLLDSGFQRNFDLTNGDSDDNTLWFGLGREIDGVTISQDTDGSIILQSLGEDGIPVSMTLPIPSQQDWDRMTEGDNTSQIREQYKSIATSGRNSARKEYLPEKNIEPIESDDHIKAENYEPRGNSYNPKAGNFNFNNQDVESLTEALYHEARGEGVEGQVAVGNVILNRTKGRWGDTVKKVVEQRKQFSYRNKGAPAPASDKKAWAVAKAIAVKLLSGQYEDNTGGADHYLNIKDSTDGGWRKSMNHTSKIGHHDFYKE